MPESNAYLIALNRAAIAAGAVAYDAAVAAYEKVLRVADAAYLTAYDAAFDASYDAAVADLDAAIDAAYAARDADLERRNAAEKAAAAHDARIARHARR